MLSPADYRAYAAVARVMAAEYRAEAVTEKEPRKSLLLKWADEREEYADFYEDRADMNEEFAIRRAAHQQKEAA